MTTSSVTGAEPVKALVVDDDLQLQAALRQMLSRAGLDVTGAGDKAEALSTAAAASPDVVVLDLSLPDGDGIEVLSELRTWSDVPVLVLTGATDPRRMLAAFEAGADDYLRKPFGPDELLARLRALMRRPRGGEEESARRSYGALEIDLAARTVSVAGERVHLTPTEWRILGALVANPGKLLTHRWMLAEVWDGSHGDETRAALRAHLRTLRAKIGDDASAPRYIATESGAGYRWTAVDGEQPESAIESAGEPAAGDETVTDVSALVHDLNNALTAARLAVALARTRVARLVGDDAPEDPDQAATPPLDDAVDQLERVGRLALRIEATVRGDSPAEAED
ncbi:response regulator transcription factor [uncultured Nocardioides sp.]|uniref:response regulator transcription factor n=1 Tax=uncultured Nocardioides sp. TaxID=198441 RepID=UPI00261593A7|nr:response regulator transcription factor [uncultured Nocardioides sp.]MCK5926637.1 response regulator transcription factor [Nocardioides sp.]